MKKKEEKDRFISVCITVPPDLWFRFQEKCKKQCRSASSKVQEFILDWEKK